MDHTTANYTLGKDGKIDVLNKGYDYKTNEWKEAKGVAKFSGEDTVGELEVSFFGPFYAAYNVLSVDNNYQYALVAGKDTDYLWMLSRQKTMPIDIITKYTNIALGLGYDLDKLVWVKQD